MSRERDAADLQRARPTGTWLFGILCLVLAALVLLYQGLTPSDGARISKNSDLRSLSSTARSGVSGHG